MNANLDRLVEALREELQNYGELLALFEQQQDHLIRRDADQVMASAGLIQGQAVLVQRARGRRVERHQELADALSVPPDGQFSTLMPALPPSRRAQVQALMEENNRLLKRVQQRARQNHLLLSHSLENLGRLIQTLTGALPGMVYNGGGAVSAASTGSPLYEAVG